jgi:hypothetical protein
MPSKNNIYTVTKVEHDFGLTKIRPKFPKMPELYLELLINKKKANSALAAEKYIHRYEPVVSSEDSIGFKPIPRITSINIREEGEETQPYQPYQPYQPKPQKSQKSQLTRKGTFNWESSDSMEPSPIMRKKITRPISSSPQVGSPQVGSPQVGSISSNRYRKVKKSIISSYYNTVTGTNKIAESKEKEPPPVKEIKKIFGDNKPRINTFENYEEAKDEDDKKRELLFKFHRLKKTYPKADLPEYNMLSNADNMKRTYDTTVKNLVIDSTVETYKSYLIMGFMGCEIVLGKIGFDMEGYTQQQTLCTNKYEKLLIELGEKSYVPSSLSNWPVEIRLMALVLFQTTIFIVSKIITKKTNVNILQMYNNVTGAYESQSRSKPQYNDTSSSGFVSGGSSPLTFIPKTKRVSSTNSEGKMRGPSATKD